MRDFKAYVRSRFAPSGLSPAQEIKIIDELAGQLEDLHQSLLDIGYSADDAWERVQHEIPDWEKLRGELVAAAPLAERLTHPHAAPFAGPLKKAFLIRLRDACARGVLQDLALALRRAR